MVLEHPLVSGPRPIVLVHGAWHDAWCWAMLQAELDRRGLASYALDLPGHGVAPEPLTDLYGDAACVAEAVQRAGEDVIVVGHSYGGAVVGEAVARLSNVAHVVFVSAFALHVGESVLSVLRALPSADVVLKAAMRPTGADELGLDVAATVTSLTTIDPASAGAVFYGCTHPAVAAAAVRRLSPQAMDSFAQPVTGSALGVAETTYVRTTMDEAVHPTHQEALANRCDHELVLDTDHCPFLSRTADLADVIEPLARCGRGGR